MLVLMAGLLISLLTTGIVGTTAYYMASSSALAVPKNLNKTAVLNKLDSEKSAKNAQSQPARVADATSSILATQQKKHKDGLQKLRDVYERQLARTQSSINQINGRMASRQDTYQKELERLRSAYASLKQRHTRLEDLMDQGWAPRMVAVPGPGLGATPDLGQNVNRRAPDASAKGKPRRKSSAGPGVFSPAHQPAPARVQLTGLKPDGAASLISSMQNLRQKQNRTSAKIDFSARKRVNEMTQVLSRLNFNLSKLKPPSTRLLQSNTGGPFVKLAQTDALTSSSTSSKIAFAAVQSFQKIYQLENALLEMPIRRPLSDLASITSPFGPRLDPFRKLYAMHRGVDFRAPQGEPVLAPAAGVVILRQKHSKSGFGNVLVIRHAYGITTLYGHLSEFSVKSGDRVKPGDVVGKVGNTGRSTGPHLHYEVRVDDSHVDPIDYLEAATYVF